MKMRILVSGFTLALVACGSGGGGGGGDNSAVSADPAPVVPAPAPGPAPNPESNPQPPAAEAPAGDPIVAQTMACRGTPPSPGNPVAFYVTFEINYALTPWKWLRQQSEGNLPFATDPDGSRVQYDPSSGTAYVPEPEPPYVPGSGAVKGAYYRFDAEGLGLVTTRQYHKDDFPVVCTRE